MSHGATCSPISRATTIVSGSTPPSATSPPIKQRRYPRNPVSTLPGEGKSLSSAFEREFFRSPSTAKPTDFHHRLSVDYRFGCPRLIAQFHGPRQRLMVSAIFALVVPPLLSW